MGKPILLQTPRYQLIEAVYRCGQLVTLTFAWKKATVHFFEHIDGKSGEDYEIVYAGIIHGEHVFEAHREVPFFDPQSPFYH